MSDAAALLATSPLFAGVGSGDLAALGRLARREDLGEGVVVARQGESAEAVYVLERGAVRVTYGPTAGPPPPDEEAGARAPGAEVAYATDQPGYALGWSAMVVPHVYRATITTVRPTRLLRLDREVLADYGAAHAEFALTFARRGLWMAGSRLRAIRLRLIAGRFRSQQEAVAALLAGHAATLPVTSLLHRIPHLLAHRLTLDDALTTLDVVAREGDQVERELAVLVGEQLHEVRAELVLFRRLQRIYEAVASAPADCPPEEVRLRSLREFQALFAETRHRIAGLHRLPEAPGHVFVMNHLVNHPDNLLPNDFILTLDTHFVASMVLLPRYGEAPIRVVRKSQPHELGHQRFFDRLGYLYVYSGHVDPREGERDSSPLQRRELFLQAAADHLAAGRNVVICPEGTSVATEESPVAFRSGAFRLARFARPEPLIVPIAVANFDKKLTQTRTVALVGEPLRVSDHVPPSAPDAALHAFVNEQVQPLMAGMVRDALRLSAAD